jgi:hypothetical protein
MKTLTTLLVLLLSAPVAAQDGPIARAVKKQYARPDLTTTTYSTQMRSPVLFWSGLAIVSAGVFVTVAALTWDQESDLSQEDLNTRLGRDLAPCGTERTVLPVADCKPNTGLLWLGASMEVGGGIMMVVGGQTVQIVSVGPHATAVRMRVRF